MKDCELSFDSKTPSEPSTTEFNTSEASPLVGLGAFIIDSNIYWQVTTGVAAMLAFSIIHF